MLRAGSKAPDFTLKNQNGDPFTLSENFGETIVLYFYPKANTPGCTTQACGIRDHRLDYSHAGARVIGVSPDPVKNIAGFDRNHVLGFTLLSDPDHKVADLYGAWVERSMYGKKYMGIQRSTFIIDREGRIARVFPKVQPKKHDDSVLKALVEMNTTT